MTLLTDYRDGVTLEIPVVGGYYCWSRVCMLIVLLH